MHFLQTTVKGTVAKCDLSRILGCFTGECADKVQQLVTKWLAVLPKVRRIGKGGLQESMMCHDRF